MSTTLPRVSLVADLYHLERASAQAAVLFHGALAARAGITVTDISCLGVLDKDGPMPAGRLARQIGLTRGGAITAALDRLEQAGFLRRQRDPGDRRKVTIELVRGEAYERLQQTLDEFSRDYLALIEEYSDEQLGLLTEFSRRSTAILDRHTATLQGAEQLSA
ncbi:MarR family transcriptional regulator [Micromonospora sp. NPDC005215]|uniref:MarR family transcriptional regulator n=1 Tax=Micromonospora sp. NPDC005215 TaxID=3157024 RepID=UPI0033B930E1